MKCMVDEVDVVLDRHKFSLCKEPRWELRRWKVSNPVVPSLYVLLKYHKPVDEDGDYKGRPVASNINAPTERIAKKLSKIFNSLTPPEGKSVLNGTEFAQLINGTTVGRNEEIGSYDVTSLYPSIPIPYTTNKVEKKLAYVDLTYVCMKQNIFQFRGSYYKQTRGTSIGNSLSSFVAELFMRDFEMSMCKDPNFPRVYHRYVDDIFVIQNKRKFDLVKDLFEKKMDLIEKGAIKFTIERQTNQKLPFLDTLVEIVDGKLTVDVYRKPSSTMRRITSDSYHDAKQKLAAYHTMANFMVHLPLSDEKVSKEIEKIVEIGRVNGYNESTIMPIINKHQRKNHS